MSNNARFIETLSNELCASAIDENNGGNQAAAGALRGLGLALHRAATSQKEQTAHVASSVDAKLLDRCIEGFEAIRRSGSIQHVHDAADEMLAELRAIEEAAQ